MRRADKHFDQIVMQAIVELALQTPFELRIVQVTWMQIEIIRVHRDGRILELNDEFYSIALGASREVEQWMLVKTQLGENAVQPWIWRHSTEVNSKVIATTYREAVQLFKEDNLTETTYTHLRQSLASVLDRVANDREVVIVRRRGERTVAMVPADELMGLLETAHLLRSPKNAQRLLTALRRAVTGKAKPEPFEKLRREMGLGAHR